MNGKLDRFSIANAPTECQFYCQGPDGNPLSGVELHISSSRSDTLQRSESIVLWSDLSGKALVVGLPIGAYSVFPLHSQYSTEAQIMHIEETKPSSIQFSMQPAASLSVVTQLGQYRAFAGRVCLYQKEKRLVCRSFNKEHSGQVHFGAMQAGTYTVQANVEGLNSVPQPVIMKSQTQNVTLTIRSFAWLKVITKQFEPKDWSLVSSNKNEERVYPFSESSVYYYPPLLTESGSWLSPGIEIGSYELRGPGKIYPIKINEGQIQTISL